MISGAPRGNKKKQRKLKQRKKLAEKIPSAFGIAGNTAAATGPRHTQDASKPGATVRIEGGAPIDAAPLSDRTAEAHGVAGGAGTELLHTLLEEVVTTPLGEYQFVHSCTNR